MYRFLFTVCLLCLTLSLRAQYTIFHTDYSRVPGDSLTRYDILNPESISLPTGGPNQVWDYSSISLVNASHISSYTGPLGPAEQVFFPQSGWAFPSGAFYFGLSLNGSAPQSLSSRGLINDGLVLEGSSTSPNPGDTILALGQAVFGEISRISFPLRFGDTFDTTVQRTIGYNAIFPSQGIDNNVVNVVQTHRVQRQIIGQGALLLPSPAGAIRYDTVLLAKTTYTQVDSFFVIDSLGNSTLAPASFLGNWSQHFQGRTITDIEYLFVAKGEDVGPLVLFENTVLQRPSQVLLIRQPNNATPVGIQATAAALGTLSLQPNPTNGAFTLRADALAGQPVSLTVLDVTGRVVYQVQHGAFTGQATADLADLPAGCYIVQLESPGGHLSQKLIRQ